MLYILLGSDRRKKVEFVDQLKLGLSDGLWGKEITSVLAKEITTVKHLQEIFRSTGFAEQKMIAIWDVDRLKPALGNALPDLIKRYALDTQDVIVIVEGSGHRKTYSQELARIFPQQVKIFGEVEEITFFDLARAVLKGDLASSLSMVQEFGIDRYTFQQFTGAMRYVLETEAIPLEKRCGLLSRLVDLDLHVRLGERDPVGAITELTLTARR